MKKAKPLRKLLTNRTIFICSTFLLTFVAMMFLCDGDNAESVSTTPDLSFSSTPTPYPLPARVYTSSFDLLTIIGQVFNNTNPLPDPSQITDQSQLITENEYFELYSNNGFLPVDIQWWQSESRQVYEYVSTRLDTAISEKVKVIFLLPRAGKNPARGTTFHEQQPVIVIFADQNTSKEQILAVLAHELGHVVIHHKYQDVNDLALDEGMATWAAGEYWEDWKGTDFNSGVRAYIQNGTFLPLFQNYYLEKAFENDSPDCIFFRDILLTEMASFMDFLIQNYGTEYLSSLFATRQPESADGQRVVYPPNFKDVFGLEFNQLEYEWLRTLLQPNQ
ncbi:MAG: M48 family metalloprotease [Anaerolineales bacterium]|nr:M48 family metalloprotease [Anaerolineales bacterium]